MKIPAKHITGWKATIAVSMSNYIEAGSIIAIATSMGFWQKSFMLSNGQVGMLAAFSANAFGAAIGAIIGGPLCDKYGRKFIYTYDLIIYMIGALLATFSLNFPMLMTAFLLTGLAVGAGVPAGWTYIAEQAPAGERAKHVGTAQLAWSIGPLIGFALAAALVPLGLIGSRLIFAHLFVIAFVTWWIRQGLDESAIWKESKEAPQKISTLRSMRTLFTRKANLTALLFLFLVYGLWNLVAGQAGIFMPRIYASAGISSVVQQDLLQILVWGVTVAVTYFGFMKYADRLPRRWLYIGGAALGIIAWLILVFAHGTLPMLIAFAILWGASSGLGAQAFYAVWTSELFATQYRAGAQGVLFFAVRFITGLLSYAFPTILATRGVPFVGKLLIVFLSAALLIGGIWAPRTQGKTLSEIELDRYGIDLDGEGPDAPSLAPSTTY
ncbi:MFS transporter, SP family, inositol transporter [Raineyella antarctica]|uniref:MFS transporter, SP family, inositol transporter n=1 Tax=Raineyella antarctica TaxID=1577474 RepID=A0A1G6GI97_9ACTN|nr:MFS transporter [Raineyella antarctica]SDB81674.1 MFS transporter, SP family, inositol transporter [Raineyella antarctica]